MKIIGTIVEYNPLHNGHVYAINKIKKESNADVVIAVMSSSFTMRADISLFDKFTKTEQAIQAGIDLVIELPFVYTVHNSDIFARNAVYLLSLANVNEIWIGSENNNPSLFEDAYNKFNDEKNQNKIKELLKEGLSYKAATSQIIDLPSNDLLGYSYFKAIKELNLNIPLKTIKRVGTNYYDETPNVYASAYAIRKDKSLSKTYCPSFVNLDNFMNYNLLFPYLKFQIQCKNINELKNIFLVEEGIENKLKEIENYDNIDDFIDNLTSKRYTKSRIQRILSYVLFNITKNDMTEIINSLPNYIRVLGFNDIGKNYLKQIKKETLIYTNIKNNLHSSLDIELKITTILDSIYNKKIKIQEQGKPIFIK